MIFFFHMNTWKHTFLFFNTKKNTTCETITPFFFIIMATCDCFYYGKMSHFIVRKYNNHIIITLFSLWWWDLSKSLSYQICYVKLIRTKFSKIIMTKVSKLMTKFTKQMKLYTCTLPNNTYIRLLFFTFNCWLFILHDVGSLFISFEF